MERDAIVVDDRNRPFNPMVNSGAIVATGLIKARDDDHRMERIVDAFSHYAGRRLPLRARSRPRPRFLRL